jgi:hypothetical protein
MPNWTANTIRAEGGLHDLEAFLKAVEGENGVFDFSRLIPVPELLKHTSSGYCTIDGEEVTSWYVIDPEKQLEGGNANVRRFTAEEEAALKEIGANNWYDWCCENWGSKWNACSPEITERCLADGYVEIRFDTAWSVPMPVLEMMFTMFPNLSLIWTWQDECDDKRYSVERDAEIEELSESET